MYKFMIFAGTTEGRELSEFLSVQENTEVTVSVATEYGETLLENQDRINILSGRMNEEEMKKLFSSEKFDLILDATHPYAEDVTKNIKKACEETACEYLRILRGAFPTENFAEAESQIYFSDVKSVVEYLSKKDGNILLTTGSKDLTSFKMINGFSDRVWARVLPMEDSLKLCTGAGLNPGHIIAMQGPFTEEMNIATLKSINARFLVTKDGGDAGGFSGKVYAAEKTGAILLIIGRPHDEQGKNLKEALTYLGERFNFKNKRTITIVGIGPGSHDGMTMEALSAVKEADLLIGAKRMLEIASPGQKTFEAVMPQAIFDYINMHSEFRNIAVLMSGDSGFFSGTKNLLPLLKEFNVKVLPGLSSLSVLSARVGISYEDAIAVSLHGREVNIMPIVQGNKKVFVLLGGGNNVKNVLNTLSVSGPENLRVHIGENLGYPDEKITSGTPEELLKGEYKSLSVLLIENEAPDYIVTPGLPDEAFLRMEGIPMTKSEVRAIALSKLQLTENAVCWDIGAGTGSVAVEMARQAKSGIVYAIEKNQSAAVLLEGNRDNLTQGNIEIIRGNAPEVLTDIPYPTHVFIGGSSGNMKEILSAVIKKNPAARIVATAVTLESISELTQIIRKVGFDETEVISITAARDRRLGSYHLMTGQNPIYIFTMQGKIK